MLRNRRGATSLRWLRALLDHGIEVHGQVVVCPGINDGAVLDDTLAGVLDRYPELASLCVVPLGVSRYNREGRMRPHTTVEAAAVVDLRGGLAGRVPASARSPAGLRRPTSTTCWPIVPSPRPRPTRGSPCTRTAWAWPARFELEFLGDKAHADRPAGGVLRLGRRVELRSTPTTSRTAGSRGDTGPAAAGAAEPTGAGRRSSPAPTAPRCWRRWWPARPRRRAGGAGRQPVLRRHHRRHRSAGGRGPRPRPRRRPVGHRYLLPDVCLSGGRFLDGTAPEDLPRPVEVVRTDGHALRAALGLMPPPRGAS